MAEDKALGQILSKIENMDSKLDSLDSKVSSLDSKVSTLDSKVSSLDSKVSSLDSKVDGIENKLSNFENEFDDFREQTDETLARIEHRSDATFEQTAMLSEFRTETLSGLDDLKDDIGYFTKKEAENEKEIYKLKQKLINN
ncbi:hypothetical protein LJ207_09930 [Halanaerobium sp. Z-7514]|uniref:t-SNARE coiled-coil homology domain-containing protein n=1 Tax=Halanaerobium polyolivorans TaxID=2886943 RepID=A0AAW4X1D5_9FIRM|nr:hypothetical protein [Halanaerobium polyolivorans]MCC3145642.1 hypothetical protein [Halanaerobium polyolivorans]